jgi:hypothetical protein
MAQTDVFALRNTGLEPFLFAEVGEELNGSLLTVLSLLARLGYDPWAEAARLVDLPKAAVIDGLTRNIAQMPLCPRALSDARATAVRVIRLLPVNNTVAAAAVGNMRESLADVPKWLPMTLLYCALMLGVGLSMLAAPRPDTPAPASNTLVDHQVHGAPAD